MVAARILELPLTSQPASGLGEREADQKIPEGGIPKGRIVELADAPDAARTSAAVDVLVRVQREGDPVAWVQPRGGELYPPDLAAAGLDLDALLVVHVPPRARRGVGIARAAELILRTGAFGGLVVDVTNGSVPRGEAWLGRLASLVREHEARCVFLGPVAKQSLGPLISLRLAPRRERVRFGRYRVVTEILKDKRGTRQTFAGPESWTGPEGMP